MKKIVKVIVWIGVAYLAIMYYMQMADLFGTLLNAESLDFIDGCLVATFEQVSTSYMPYKWLVWTFLARPVKACLLLAAGDLIDGFVIKGKKVAA